MLLVNIITLMQTLQKFDWSVFFIHACPKVTNFYKCWVFQ